MRFLGCTYALLASLACQASASEPTRTATGPEPVVARGADGAVLATVTSARPCRVQVGAQTASVTALPLIADVGGARWTSETTEAGTLLLKGTDLAARVLDTGPTLAVFDPTGVAWIRVDAHGDIHGPGGQLLRSVRADGAALHVGDATVTGTHDAVLAAALTSPELPADVRALVACHRLLSNEATTP